MPRRVIAGVRDLSKNSPERAQQIWARVAGFAFLFLIAVFMGADQVMSSITHSASFAETAARIAASQPLYRAALSGQVAGAVGTVLLAAALYATLRPVNASLARLALCWRLGEATLEGVTCAASFAVVRLYTAPQSFAAFEPGQVQALVSLLRTFQGCTFHIITILFGCGSTLFFYLFVTSRYLPRVISVFGLLASIIVPIMGLASLIVPENANLFQNGWYPIFVAELVAGFWLLLFGVNTAAYRSAPRSE